MPGRSMIQFEEINKDSWEKLRKAIIRGELQFPSKIRTSQKEYKSIISDSKSIAVAMYKEGDYAGNAIGYGLVHEDLKDHPGLEELENYEKTVYLFNIIVEKRFRGEGLGRQLFNEFCRMATEHGYEAIVGHFRANASSSLIQKKGGIELARFKEWEGTNEEYVLFWMPL